jgi:hypothetical protein
VLELTPIGEQLQRPECVLATAGGDLYTSDWRGGVTQIRPDGGQTLYTGRCADLDGPPRPNGIALEPDGAFLLAHLGESEGGILRLERSGELTPLVQEVDGGRLPPTNFVTRDREGRLWVTVSTRRRPRARDYRPDAGSGFIVLDDGRGPRTVADGLGYANECRVSPNGRWLYVNETMARRLARFPLRRDGSLGPKEVVAEFGPGGFADGLTLSADGTVWITCVIGNRVLHVAPDGSFTSWLDAGDPDYIATVEAAFRAGRMGAEHMASAGGSLLGNVSSIALAGPRTAYLGSLLNHHLLRAESRRSRPSAPRARSDRGASVSQGER